MRTLQSAGAQPWRIHCQAQLAADAAFSSTVMSTSVSPVAGEWSTWAPFPDPRHGAFLNAPFGVGMYELRRTPDVGYVLRGIGANCASRMSSLLPAPFGCGTRNNSAKREYVLANLASIEYRCRTFDSIDTARISETELRRSAPCIFNT